MSIVERPLRERKRAQTWAAIHDSAVELVRQQGFARATVETIADRAGVSRRTLFNYFATKEDAVLGTRPPALSAEALERFRTSHEDAIGRVVRLVTTVIRSAINEPERFAQRRELMAHCPELRARLDEHIRDSELLAHTVITRERFDDSIDDDESARVLLGIAGAVLRYAYAHDPERALAEDSPAIDDAIAQFRTVLKHLS